MLSDGDDNSGGIGLDAISALRNRRIPVHTVGFGNLQTPSDVEINDAIVAGRALANSRLAATVGFRQHGYAGQKATVRVSDGDKVLAAHEIVFGPDDAIQTENLLFNAGAAGARTSISPDDPRPGELNWLNNNVSRLVLCEFRTNGESLLCRRRAAVAVQVHAPRRGRRPDRANRLNAAHQREQDLSPRSQRSQGIGRRLPCEGGGPLYLSGADHWLDGSKLLHARSAGFD